MDNPFEPMNRAGGAEADPPDLAPVPVSITVAGVVALMAGVIHLTAAAQLWMFFVLPGRYAVAPWLMCGLGVGLLFAGSGILRLRPSGVFGACVVGSLSAAAGGLWLLMITAAGLLSPLQALLPLTGMLSAGLGFAVLRPLLAAHAARSALFGDAL